MNGDWNPSNNLKKTCSDFTLVIRVQREMGLGFFRDRYSRNGFGGFKGREREESSVLFQGSNCVLILVYIVNEIF